VEFFKEFNIIIQQGCIGLIKSDIKDIKNMFSISNKCSYFELLIQQRVLKQKILKIQKSI